MRSTRLYAHGERDNRRTRESSLLTPLNLNWPQTLTGHERRSKRHQRSAYGSPTRCTAGLVTVHKGHADGWQEWSRLSIEFRWNAYMLSCIHPSSHCHPHDGPALLIGSHSTDSQCHQTGPFSYLDHCSSSSSKKTHACQNSDPCSVFSRQYLAGQAKSSLVDAHCGVFGRLTTGGWLLLLVALLLVTWRLIADVCAVTRLLFLGRR